MITETIEKAKDYINNNDVYDEARKERLKFLVEKLLKT